MVVGCLVCFWAVFSGVVWLGCRVALRLPMAMSVVSFWFGIGWCGLGLILCFVCCFNVVCCLDGRMGLGELMVGLAGKVFCWWLVRHVAFV